MNLAIMITTYQRPDGKSPFYLKRSIDSVFNQTHQDFKLYVMGDKYDDSNELFNIVSNYPQEKIYCENLPIAYEREKYKDNKRAFWCSCATYTVNYAFDIILKDGFKYICHLDHDDYWQPNHLKVLNDVIEETGADWLCTQSVHISGVRPEIVTDKKYVVYYPAPDMLINSSTCINLVTIPIRPRDVFAEGGKPYPADADRWRRVTPYIKENNLKSYFVNSLTCVHEVEGHVK